MEETIKVQILQCKHDESAQEVDENGEPRKKERDETFGVELIAI